jgi:hypothetical protein
MCAIILHTKLDFPPFALTTNYIIQNNEIVLQYVYKYMKYMKYLHILYVYLPHAWEFDFQNDFFRQSNFLLACIGKSRFDLETVGLIELESFV